MVITVVSILLIFVIVKAGSITPPSGEPTAQFYTLSEIYTRLTTNAASTEGGHDFTFSDSLAGTGRTLTEIYNAIPTIVAGTVKLGTSYLGVAGTLTPDGGTATAADLFNSKTAHLTGDWGLDTGTLDLACNTATFDGTENLVATAYDGAGDGSNRWCMTDTGDAIAADIFNSKLGWVDGSEITGTLDLACNTATFDGTENLVATAYDGAGIGNNRWCMTDTGDVAASEMKTGKIAWVDGQAVTGTGTQTLSADSETVAAGYYDATALSTVDSDLAAGNILSGTTIFGIDGTVNAGYTYGDEDQSKVLTIATSAGTYDVSNLTTETVKLDTTFGVSSTGILTPASGAQESLTATNTLCGSKYFGSGATSWIVQEGTGCAVCKECSASSCVNIAVVF